MHGLEAMHVCMYLHVCQLDVHDIHADVHLIQLLWARIHTGTVKCRQIQEDAYHIYNVLHYVHVQYAFSCILCTCVMYVLHIHKHTSMHHHDMSAVCALLRLSLFWLLKDGSSQCWSSSSHHWPISTFSVCFFPSAATSCVSHCSPSPIFVSACNYKSCPDHQCQSCCVVLSPGCRGEELCSTLGGESKKLSLTQWLHPRRRCPAYCNYAICIICIIWNPCILFYIICILFAYYTYYNMPYYLHKIQIYIGMFLHILFHIFILFTYSYTFIAFAYYAFCA
jgi:hypothetical protein